MLNSNLQKKYSCFELESQRARLATQKKLKQLIKLYSSKFPEIQGENTGKVWDNLNLKIKPLIKKNPMEDDRLNYVSRTIIGKKLNILNIGFGSASLEEKFFQNVKTKFIHWTGIDISKKSVKQAIKKYPQATFKVGNIIKLEKNNNSFDYIVALEVFEHIQSKYTLGVLKKIFKLVKRGKFFIISVPLNEDLESLIAKGNNSNEHVRIYTPDLIKAELELVGFRIIKEKKLYAFHNYYKLKSFIARFCLNTFKYNNIIIIAQKPEK
jgi:2-polyprenyl-3-methyl-5-hydroxy-6-metoxy-1,4-benzoquinol methylase